MSVPTTMFHLSGRGYPPAKLNNASLVIIDAQKEYLSGPLALSGMDAAVANIAKMLEAARRPGARSSTCVTWVPSAACSTRRARAVSSSRALSRRAMR